jgi:hypothetical protein
MDTLFHQLDYIQFNLQNVIIDDFDVMPFCNLIQNIISEGKIMNISNTIDVLDDITYDIMDYLNKSSITLLSKIGLFPLPQSLTPKIRPF